MRVGVGCIGVDGDDERVVAAIAGVRSDGVELACGDSAATSSVMLVFVGAVDADALRRVCEIAAGADRVLAVIVGEHVARDQLALLGAGASDVLVWRGAETFPAIGNRLTRWLAVEGLLEAPIVRDNLVGTSRTWRQVLRRVVEISRFTNASLLLAGESGTGKELVARLVHTLDPRPDKSELVVVDCTTIVPTLSGSEFFGHERGAFTGAVGPRDGAFAVANRGTLFLDEVADLPLALQGQLLRVVQERTYKRVGGNEWQHADFRLVCASHRDLAAAVKRGEFRHDLYHRIATWTLQLPSLADRAEDIPVLVRHFLDQMRPLLHGRLHVEPAVEQYLVGRRYPGNIRELLHTVQRLVDRCPGDGPISVGQIPEDERSGLHDVAPLWPDDVFAEAVRRAVVTGVGLKALRKTAEDLAVQIALALENGNVARASRQLGVTERALQLRQAARRDQPEEDDPN